jgi:arylsulfatase A-like enzyme
MSLDARAKIWDFLPTMSELTHQQTPAGLDGVSILPALLGTGRVEHPPLYWEFHERGFDQAARIGDWKAVRRSVRGPIELYNLADDPGEKHDVAASHPEVVGRLDAYLRSARVDSELWPIREPARKKAAAGTKTR